MRGRARAATPGDGGSAPASPGRVLALIAGGTAQTRADIARLTGLARSTVSQRVDALIAHGLLDEPTETGAGGRRLSRRLRLRTRDQLVLGVGLGATHGRVSLLDVAGAELATGEEPLRVAEGPEGVLGRVACLAHELLDAVGQPPTALRAIGVGLPGPVEFRTGQPVDPPIMPGWHRFPVPAFLTDRLGATTLVDNDVNLMALAERRRHLPGVDHLLFVKMGTGIGCGIVAGGQLHRGARGSAGDIGHIRVGTDETPCRCGNLGCLEATVGGAALARRLGTPDAPLTATTEVVRLVKSGDREAVRLVREAGRAVGEVLAGLVNFFNPEAVVFGGALAAAHDQLLAGVREVVYRRSHPLATRNLRIEPSGAGRDAVALGAGLLAVDHALSPRQVDEVVSPGGGPGR
ncbi:ROK family transcriptional regulator [Streptomyces profundus]|uniref:ROK family transcriptional regulator n=1 Tax=Streptomyces profundus TaxID=2867410 RepID=UPI001D16123D|nr:ROK family transcriptional regulator [Streptomyces sp. MA3_2.13]UED83258.1 ROK family transcriptional regulator [Streptomyces sp. MA3_2.13]